LFLGGRSYHKEASLNPTNPEDRAPDWEADIIHGVPLTKKMDGVENMDKLLQIGCKAGQVVDPLHLGSFIQAAICG
jgi:hypothetical protein